MSEANLTATPHQQFYEEVALRPLGSRIVAVTEDAELQKTKSGLWLPAKDREKPLLCRVVSVGPKVREIQPRDLVIFERYAGAEIRATNKPAVLVMDEADVMAVVERGGIYDFEKYMHDLQEVTRAAIRYINDAGEDPSDWRDSLDFLKRAVENYVAKSTEAA